MKKQKKLAVRKDSGVNQLIKVIAEDKDSNPSKAGNMKRHIWSLIERLSTICTGWIHQQFINVCCLRNVLIFLIPLLIILISLQSVLVPAESINDVVGFSWNSGINIFDIFANPLLIVVGMTRIV